MQASWVRESTATTGTGTITLGGASAGYIQFEDAFTTTNVVHYTITDGNNRETGIGTLTTGGSWTLSRDQIFEKLDNGTYSNWPATGISLSGTAIIGISPNAGSTFTPSVDYVFTGHYSLAAGLVGTTGANPVAANRLYVLPFVLQGPKKISSIVAYVSTQDAGATVTRIGIYGPDETGKPEFLLADVGIDVTSTGLKSTALGSPIYLNPGIYYAAFVTDGTPSVSTVLAREQGATSMSVSSVFAISTLYKTLSSWSALPDPFGAVTGVIPNSAGPIIGTTA